MIIQPIIFVITFVFGIIILKPSDLDLPYLYSISLFIHSVIWIIQASVFNRKNKIENAIDTEVGEPYVAVDNNERPRFSFSDSLTAIFHAIISMFISFLFVMYNL